MTEEKLTYKGRTLNIDMDKECNRCSEKGATKSGLCLKCLAETLGNKTINFNVINQAQAEVCAMLFEYAKEIDEAYLKADNDLTVALSLKLSPTRIAGEIELTVGINFVESRIKHAVKVVVDSKQKKLPGF